MRIPYKLSPHPNRKHRILFHQEYYVRESYLLQKIQELKSPFNDSYVTRADVIALLEDQTSKGSGGL